MSIPDTTVRLLEAVSYFADLDADILQTIALRCQSKSLLSRRPVFMEGDPCKHLYILESGCVKFYRSRTSKAALGQSATTCGLPFGPHSSGRATSPVRKPAWPRR